MKEAIQQLPEGLYDKKKLIELELHEDCPYCHSSKTTLLIHGTVRKYQCGTCNQFFFPPD